ncbi:D-2-hydroxyacid dehydrogenase [Treponema sp. OMZ 840]|uniref:D-2-hydroxyacid dehydrogenase n=1 Tax=Treponema sp. OMZ 840 TaxID=244313 RepID=UPI003D8A78A1
MEKIVVLDGYTENPGDLSWDELGQLGDLTVYDRTPADKIIERIGNAAYVYTNKTPITKQTIHACPHLKFIGVLATGYNVIDVQAAKEKNIIVSNIPTYGTQAVSQYVFALLLEICHHVAHHCTAVYEGRWTSNPDWCFWDYPLIELAGKTLGVIGFGRIGQSTAKIAQALGMNVIAYDEYKSDEGRKLASYVPLETLYKQSDVISLHVPLFPSTEGMINRHSIEKMKNNVIIINTSRGPLVKEDDMAEALNSGKVYYYAADVVSSEPILKTNPLLKAKNCIITPHIAWAPKESRQRLMNIAVDNLKHFLKGTPVNIVNS